MEEARNNPSMATGESQKQAGGYSGSTETQKESPLCYTDGHLSLQERGVRTPQMTAKVMDVIARLPDCDGQAVDAVSAYTQVKLEDAPKLLRIPKSECPVIWIRLPRHKWPKSWENIRNAVVPLERNLHGHPISRIVVGKTVRRTSLETEMGTSTELGMFGCYSKTRQILIGKRGRHKKWLKRSRTWLPCGRNWWDMWKKDEPTPILDHVHLGCTRRECQPNETRIEQF